MLLIPFFCFSQREANNWYFGINSGITFNTDPPSPLTGGALHNQGGGSSMSDKNGNLLFYTDGQTVWNKNHVPMPNGTGLKGFPRSPQPAIIIPFDEKKSSKFYVFTTDGGNFPNDSVFAYSVVDMSLNGGLGDVLQKNIFLFKPAYQIMAAVKHKNGRDTWLLTHKALTNSFYAYLITSCGITGPIISSLGLIEDTFTNQNLKFSPDGKRVALSLTGSGYLHLFDFDNNSGIVSNARDFGLLSGGYGYSFSPNSSLLYVVNGTYLIQYNLLAGDHPDILASKENIYFSLFPDPAQDVRIGCNGKMYVNKVNSTSLGIIHNPNVPGLGCNYVNEGLSYSKGAGDSRSLPNFTESYFDSTWQVSQLDIHQLSFSSSRVCLGDSSSFTMINQTEHPFMWNFGDPLSGSANTSNIKNPKHLFSKPGKYDVALISYVTCIPDTIIQSVMVDSFPSLNLGPDQYICSGTDFFLKAESGYTSYTWQDGSTSKDFRTDAPGTYYLQVSNYCGSVRDTINLKEYQIFIPNLITPNKDGWNDSFKIIGLEGNNGVLKIYNSWGEEVLNNSNYQNDWNANGLSDGIYYYIFSFGTCQPINGWIHVVR